MSLNTGYFPPYAYRRKQTTASFNYHHAPTSLPSARSSIENSNVNESFLPSISNVNNHNDCHKPYRRNDFANNHLFIAKCKLAGIFLGQPTRNLQATSELIHLFDEQEPKQKRQNLNKNKRQKNLINKTLPYEQDSHLSVVNLVMKPPYPLSQTRDQLSTMLHHRRSQANHLLPKGPRSSIDTTKQNFRSTSIHTFTDDNEINELIDNDNISDAAISTTINSSILCVKAIIPSTGPQHR